MWVAVSVTSRQIEHHPHPTLTESTQIYVIHYSLYVSKQEKYPLFLSVFLRKVQMVRAFCLRIIHDDNSRKEINIQVQDIYLDICR